MSSPRRDTGREALEDERRRYSLERDSREDEARERKAA